MDSKTHSFSYLNISEIKSLLRLKLGVTFPLVPEATMCLTIHSLRAGGTQCHQSIAHGAPGGRVRLTPHSFVGSGKKNSRVNLGSGGSSQGPMEDARSRWELERRSVDGGQGQGHERPTGWGRSELGWVPLSGISATVSVCPLSFYPSDERLLLISPVPGPALVLLGKVTPSCPWEPAGHLLFWAARVNGGHGS